MEPEIAQGHFRKCFRRYKQGKVTIIYEKYKLKFDYLITRREFLKSNGIGRTNKKYSIHHILPTHCFPDRYMDIDNFIPLKKDIHDHLHYEYTREELLIDPIGSIISVLSDYMNPVKAMYSCNIPIETIRSSQVSV